MKWMVVASTRPEVIKVSPVLEALERRGIEHLFVTTGQHYDDALFGQFIRDLGLRDPDFNIQVGSGTQGGQTGDGLKGLESLMLEESPGVVAAEGDTNSVLSAALAAVKLKIPFAHIEAGLRSFDRTMPEEINRILADHCSQVLFAPTELAALNLLDEGIPPGRIHIVGNTIVDAVQQNIRRVRKKGPEDLPKEYLVLTLHRAENVDDPGRLGGILRGLSEAAMDIIFPVHPRTKRMLERDVEVPGNIKLMDPLGYLEFLTMLEGARAVLTDSGGVQEEAICLDVPCITLRTTTERPETVEAGGNILAGVNPERIKETLARVLRDGDLYQRMKSAKNPYGDGTTGEKIVKITEEMAAEGTLGLSPPDLTAGYPKRRLVPVGPDLAGKRVGEAGLAIQRIIEEGRPRFPSRDLVLRQGQLMEVLENWG